MATKLAQTTTSAASVPHSSRQVSEGWRRAVPAMASSCVRDAAGMASLTPPG